MYVIKFTNNQGTRTGIFIARGRKFQTVLLMDNPLRIKSLRINDEGYTYNIIEILGYSLPRAKAHFRHAAKRWNGDISKKVREVIKA